MPWPRPSLDVHLSKRVIVGAAIAFALLIGAVGFLLGRESRRPRRAVESAPSILAAAQAADPPAVAAIARPSAHSAGAAVPDAPSPSAATGAAPPTPGARTATPPLPTTAAVDADPAIEVRNYFVQMASIQSAGPTGDPTELANKLLASAAGGDPSGFNALIKDVDSGIARAQQLHVPAACQDYHQKTLDLLAESGRMLRTLQSSIARQDTDGLGALAASATSLQTRADALNAQGRQIRARYGLAN